MFNRLLPMDKYLIIFIIFSFILLASLMLWLVINKYRKKRRKGKNFDLAGIENNNKSCFFNTTMQIFATMDEFYKYLQNSKLGNNSLTKMVYRFVYKIKEEKEIIDNREYYYRIMNHFDNKIFKIDGENSVDEFMIHLLHLLMQEELNIKNIHIHSFEELTEEEYNLLLEESTLFNLFFLVSTSPGIKSTISVEIMPLNTIQNTIDSFLSSENQCYIPNWYNFFIIHNPKYLILPFTSRNLSSNDFEFTKNLFIKMNNTKYQSNSIVLYGKAYLFYNHYSVISKRKDEYYLFDDMIINKFYEEIEKNKFITLLVYERID